MDSEQSQLNIPSDAQTNMRNSFAQEKKGRLEGSNDEVTLDNIDAQSEQDRVDISHAGVEGRENQRKTHHGRSRRDELSFRDQFRGGLDEQVHLLRNPDYRAPGAHEADEVPRHHTKPQESFAPVEIENSINRQQFQTEENIQSSERDIEGRNEEQSERSEQSSKDQEQGESEQQEQESVGIVGRVKEGAQHAIDSVTSSVGRAKDLVVNAMQGVKQRVLGISPSEEGEQEGEQKEEQDEGENLSRDGNKLDIQDQQQTDSKQTDSKQTDSKQTDSKQEQSQEGQQEGQEEEREQFADVARAQATLFEPLQQRSVSKPVEEKQQPITQGGKKKKFKGHRKINPALEMNIDDEEFEDEFEQDDINAGVSEGSQLYLEKKSEYNIQHSQSDNLIGTSGGL